jgi:CubicO group peptidase (beta-lactamase class C family)
MVLYNKALQKAVFLNDSIIEQSKNITPWEHWSDSTPPFIGSSWFIGKTPDGLKTVGHTGSQGGFLANYVTIPEKKIFFVILCNTPRDVDGYTAFITNWLMENKWLEN